MPVSIKDLFDVPGLPTTKGSLVYKDNVATSWEYSAKALIDAGGVHLGKTNTPEFGFIAMTSNKLFGATVNPWDTTRIAGGSSGGAASAVAAGLGPIAHGSDGGGSIRIPASICGVFGLKPTFGRIPKKPGGWSTMTHRGPITRTVSDAALALDVMAHYEPADPFSVATYPGSFLARSSGPSRGCASHGRGISASRPSNRKSPTSASGRRSGSRSWVATSRKLRRGSATNR